jgi:predicted transcriptional regulator
MATTIQVTEKTKDALAKMRLFPKEPYEEVILRLIEIGKEEEEELRTETIQTIEKALEDVKRGRLYSTEEVKKELGIS